MIGIGDRKFAGTQSACQFVLVERAVVVGIEPREQFGRSLLYLREVERAVASVSNT